MNYKTTKFRDLRAKYIWGKSFQRLDPKFQKIIVESEIKLKKQVRKSK